MPIKFKYRHAAKSTKEVYLTLSLTSTGVPNFMWFNISFRILIIGVAPIPRPMRKRTS